MTMWTSRVWEDLDCKCREAHWEAHHRPQDGDTQHGARSITHKDAGSPDEAQYLRLRCSTSKGQGKKRVWRGHEMNYIYSPEVYHNTNTIIT